MTCHPKKYSWRPAPPSFAALLAATVADAQQQAKTQTGERDHSASDPGPENRPLLEENPSSNLPPPTDTGDVGPIWYSFDLTHKRIQEGGRTHQVTQRELPSSKDLAGVNMRLTAGSFRELHWHTANEWAIMLAANARRCVLNPDATVFLDDVAKGDLWYFPAAAVARHFIVRNHPMSLSVSNPVTLPVRQCRKESSLDEKLHRGCLGPDPSRS